MQDVAQYRGREAPGELDGAGQRGVGVPQKGHPDLVTQRPLWVMADGIDEGRSCVGTLQCLYDGGLGQAWILERRLPNPRFFIKQQTGRHQR